MSHDTVIYTDAHGDVTEAQGRLYRASNVSPSEHATLVQVYGRDAGGREQIMLAVREFTRDGRYQECDMLRDARRKGRI